MAAASKSTAGSRGAPGSWLALVFAVVGANADEPPAYRILERPKVGWSLEEQFSRGEIELLEKLNRADMDDLPRLAVLVVPERFDLPELAHSPLPHRHEWAARFPKAMIVHLPVQAFGAYENGNLVRWGPISSGREELRTPPGLFHLNWKSRGRSSTVDPDWYMEWYFNFDSDRGLSLHAYSLPGYPASHACIRLLERDAKWLYGWGEGWTLDARGWNVLERGTPLWVVGRYDFGSPPPWQSPDGPGRPVDLPDAPAGDRDVADTGQGG